MSEDYSELLDSLPYAPITEAIRVSTHGIFEVCRRKAGSEHLYGFVWGADQDVTSVDWRANTEEKLLASTEKQYSEARAQVPDLTYSLEHYLRSNRYDPMAWNVSTDIPVPEAEQDFNPSDIIYHVWEEFEDLPIDEDDQFDLYDVVQVRILDAIVAGLAKFDAEYTWSGLDRSQFLVSVFVWDGTPERNLNAARRLNSPSMFQRFRESYAPATATDVESDVSSVDDE